MGPRAAAGSAPAAERVGHAPQTCDSALARAFSFLGKRWNGVLLGTLASGPLGFGDLRRAVDGISDSVLSARLGELSTAGLLLREVDPGPPVAVTYRLSAAGEALLPALDALGSWARQNLTESGCARAATRGEG